MKSEHGIKGARISYLSKDLSHRVGELTQGSSRFFEGIKENITNFNSNISIMPNPTSGQFNLIFTLPKEEELFIKIYNSIGQQISSEHLQNVSNNLINLDLSNKPSGIYFTEISNGTERVIKKIIVNH